MSNRPTSDETLLQVAYVMALRGTCPRLNVGAVLARDTRIIGSGWNGAPPGMKHCRHEFDESCRVAIHAERNVIGFAARHGVATGGTSLFITHAPCLDCSTVIIAAGITRVVYGVEYGSFDGITRLRECGVFVQSRTDMHL